MVGGGAFGLALNLTARVSVPFHLHADIPMEHGAPALAPFLLYFFIVDGQQKQSSGRASHPGRSWGVICPGRYRPQCVWPDTIACTVDLLQTQ